MPLIVKNNAVLRDAPVAPSVLLQQHSGGAYTAALVKGSRCVVDWQLHLGRLKDSLSILSKGLPCLADRERYAAVSDAFVDSAVAASVQTAIQEHGRAEPGDPDLMIVVIVSPLMGTHDALHSGHGEQSPPDCAHSIPADTHPPAAGREGTDSSGCSASKPPVPLDVIVHCATAPAPPAGPLAVVALPGQRYPANAKYCKWALERRSLESSKPPGTSEVTCRRL